MSSYSLDLAFSSATAPNDPTQPILAVGYGFSELPDGEGEHWTEKGQRTLVVKRNRPFYFTAFDIAPAAQPLSSFVVDFGSGDSPFWDTESKTRLPGKIICTGDQIKSQSGHSAGCNVIGLYSMIGPFTVAEDIPDKRFFGCTVHLMAKGQVFQVDPEIQVDGGSGGGGGGDEGNGNEYSAPVA